MLQKFVFENSNLNVVFENNNPLFFGKQVAEILGYKDTDKAIRVHVDSKYKIEWKSLENPLPASGAGEVFRPRKILLKEAGLYSLIFGSELPRARRFRDWVFEEVLPQIRDTGSYSLDSKLLKLKDISEYDIKNMDPVQKKEFKGELKKFAELLKDPRKQEKGSRGGNALWKRLREQEELYEELKKKFAAISLILGD